MDICHHPDLLTVASALNVMRQSVTPVTEFESVALLESLDRVLATSVYSSINVPGYDNSAMDGYALRSQDAHENAVFTIIGQSLAGSSFDGIIQKNECVRVTTGATIPAGADTVIMQEQVSIGTDSITVNRAPNVYENIRRAGEDIRQDSLVFAQGRRVRAIDIGLLASLGIAEVNVYRRLRIAIVSTGDELTPPGQNLKPGCIYDSNRYALHALLKRLNVEIIDLGLVRDDPEAIKNIFLRAMHEVDIIISSGGVSVGDADYVKDVLGELGTINFWKVAMKPGKPFAFGNLGQCRFFGLPGNPVSAVVTFHQLVVPTLRFISGEVFAAIHTLSAIAATDLKKQPGRADYQRGILRCENGINNVYSTGTQGSGMLTSMAEANCFIVLEQERGNVAQGELVNVELFDRFIY